MKIKMSSNVLIIVFLWIIVAIINLGMIGMILIFGITEFFLAVLVSMSSITFVGAVFNSINYFMVYKDFLTLTKGSIIVNVGLVRKKKILNLADIRNIKYNKNRNRIIFYMTDGIKESISLLCITKGDKIMIYEFLTSNSINVIT